MSKSTTSSFVVQIPLITNSNQEAILSKKLGLRDAIYNACLGEALRRLDLMRQSKKWQKQRNTQDKKAKRKLIQECTKYFGFSEYSLGTWAKQFTKSYFNENLCARTISAICSNAFSRVQQYSFNKIGRPYFKPRFSSKSIENTTQSHPTFENNCFQWDGKNTPRELNLNAKYIDPYVEEALQNNRIKYTQILKKTENKREQFYAQVVLEGIAPLNPDIKIGKGKVGIDLGPSTITIVSETHAFIVDMKQFIHKLDPEKRRLSRKMDRQRRQNNPDNYNPDGTTKKRTERKPWTISKRYKETLAELGCIQTKLAAYRKNLLNHIANQILSLGNVFNIENNSIKGWQAGLFGKSVGSYAPGMFLASLKRTAKKYGGTVNEVSTYDTKFSQRCLCGNIKKKELSERQHNCTECGLDIQRDILSAYLLKFFDNEITVDAGVLAAKQAYPGACNLLRSASIVNKLPLLA